MQFNWVDLVFLVGIVYFAVNNSGFAFTLIEVCGFFLALFVSYNTYDMLSPLFAKYFSLPSGYASVVAFFTAWTITELIFFFTVHIVFRNLIARIKKHPLDMVLGYSLGMVQGALIFLFFISLVFGLPVRGSIKQDVLNSAVGPFFVDISRSTESRIKEVFGEAANETLNFLTVKPQSGETVDLGFKAVQTQIRVDPVSEEIMLNLLNKERQERGLSTLTPDPKLQAVAREYAQKMLSEGFFSHTSTDGSTAAERAQRAGIEYAVLGENLAFAPDAYVAHQGLMNSPGHKANILSPEFGKAGIGVADAGVYGRMFVQMFSD